MPLIGSYTFVTEGLLGLLNDGARYLQRCSFYHWHALTVRLQQGFYRKIRPSGYLEAKIFRWANLSGENVAGEVFMVSCPGTATYHLHDDSDIH